MEEDKKYMWEEIHAKKDCPWMKNTLPKKLEEKFLSYFEEDDEILDYGCGNGLFAKIFTKNGLNVVGADISERILKQAVKKVPSAEFVQTDTPKIFVGEDYEFDGIFVWGLLQYIEKDEWKSYLEIFKSILRKGGPLLIGGPTNKSEEFKEGHKISEVTGKISYAIDDIEEIAKEIGFEIIESDCFEFKEAFRDTKMTFKYFLLINPEN